MKRSNLFMLEALLALAIITAFFIYITPFLIPSNNKIQNLQNYADQSISLLRNMETSKLDQNILAVIPEELKCSDCKLSQQIATLIYYDSTEAAKDITSTILANMIPLRYGFSISLTGENYDNEIIIRDSENQENLISSSSMVSGIKNLPESDDIFLLEIKIWV